MKSQLQHSALWGLRTLSVVLAYVLTGWWGLQMPYAGSYVTLMWLPTGIAVAALWNWGTPMLAGVAVGAVLVNLLVGSSLGLALAIGIGNTLAPWVAVLILKRLAFRASFERRRDVVAFFLSATGGMTVSAGLGAFCLLTAGAIPAANFLDAALPWWMGDSAGVLLGAPVLWAIRRDALKVLSTELRGFLLWLSLATPALWFAFGQRAELFAHNLPMALLTVPLLVWAALRFGRQIGALAALAFSLAAAWGTARGSGAFYLSDTQSGLFLAWSYMVTVTIMGLLITALNAERSGIESEVRHSQAKLQGLYELAPLGIALTDFRGTFLEFNQAFQRICGYTEQELRGMTHRDLSGAAYRVKDAEHFASLMQSGFYGPYELEYARKDGSVVPVRINGMLISGEHGKPLIWSIIEDVSDRKRYETDLRIAATAFEAEVGILVTDPSTRILRVNQAFCNDTGYTQEEVIGETPRILRSGRHDQAFYAQLWDSINRTGSWQGELWDRRKDGGVYPSWTTISAIRNEEGELTHFVSTRVNISERKAAEDEAKNLAFFDPLTNLPNRRLFQDRLHQALASGNRSKRHGALLFIDLDNFKTLNDSWGHLNGDQLLQDVAQRLTSLLRQGDTVARLGGDEFVVLLEELSEDVVEAASQAECIATKLCAALNRVHQVDGKSFHSTASIGVTLFCGSDAPIEDLMQQADLAMYRAKETGRNAVRFFDPSMQASVRRRVELETELRAALESDQLLLHFQAQVNRTGLCAGAEALLRWRHPTRGLVYPNDFIGLAEETQLILPIGQWVLAAACQQLARWKGAPETAHWTLAVNVSAVQVQQSSFVSDVLEAVHRHGADPKHLKLELTESLLLQDVDATIAKMNELKQHGIGFALDDFGTGYSSLSYIQRLPLSTLKIDRSFVSDVLGSSNAATIARTIVTLAEALELEVLAEGVENSEQHEFLDGLGCNAFQGYLFGKPMDLEAFETRYRMPFALDSAADWFPAQPDRDDSKAKP